MPVVFIIEAAPGIRTGAKKKGDNQHTKKL
jgi:hypothetical protein